MLSSKLDIVDIVLADDDIDDCLLFKDALEEFNAPALHISISANGIGFEPQFRRKNF